MLAHLGCRLVLYTHERACEKDTTR
jgi:hypothetical protein